MDLFSILFSFQGRMRRSHFWAVRLGFPFVAFATLVSLLLVLGLITGFDQTHAWPAYKPVGILMYAATFAAIVWADLAASVKRCHDRDKTGWFLLISLIPLIGGLWLLVELSFLDGEPGTNKYGPSPKFPQARIQALT